MTPQDAQERREALSETIKGAGITRAQAADQLFVSIHTLNAWLRPVGSKAGNPAPLWAIDLLARKTGQPPHPVVVSADASMNS